ncbi:MAG: beta-galactosidase [Candidatus Hydrogenedentes bacterium]|nr:beta-galactosidase [Candidatus Hydrogenedentota bacterium]
MSLILATILIASAAATEGAVDVVSIASDGGVAGFVCTTPDFEIAQRNGAWSVSPPPDRDPYSVQPLAFHGRADIPADWPSFVLEVAHLDVGAGLIGAAVKRETGGGWRGANRSVSYTRLNTGAARTAWFSFDRAALPETDAWSLQLTGMRHLTGVRILPPQADGAWAAKSASVPCDVKPMVTLERPMDLVCSAGVDVRGGIEALDSSLAALNELAPLARVLGFNAVESYVSWKRVEPRAEGEFDFSFYDAIVAKLAEYDLKWFPLLIVGSAYALPEWFLESDENVGMVCLEHGLSNPVQSICYEPHRRHVTRVLEAFGRHYEPMGVLQGVRLGPSGNYGESQYPAGGNWGVDGADMHIHLGWWAGDAHAQADYRRYLADRYADVAALNAAWGTDHASFDAIAPRLPEQMLLPAERIDFTAWYTDLMTDWCEWWALEARKAMPNTPIYQSAGGWGFRESGTDYTAQTKSMTLINGGIRLTNETDSFEQNFYATRLAVTAAKHYGVPLGYEPASSHTARGVAGRVFGTLVTGGEHFFTYQQNIMNDTYAIDQWLEYAPLLDERAMGQTSVAVFYPETVNQLEDSAFRYLYAWGFNPRAAAVRRVTEVDYLDERLIDEGFLDRYRVLVFVWGTVMPDATLAKIDAWVKAGGTVIYPAFPRGNLTGLSGSAEIFQGWSGGETGQGAFYRFRGDMEPESLYADFVRGALVESDALSAKERALLAVERPEQVFFSVLESGRIAALNYNPEAVTLAVEGGREIRVPGYGIALFGMGE